MDFFYGLGTRINIVEQFFGIIILELLKWLWNLCLRNMNCQLSSIVAAVILCIIVVYKISQIDEEYWKEFLPFVWPVGVGERFFSENSIFYLNHHLDYFSFSLSRKVAPSYFVIMYDIKWVEIFLKSLTLATVKTFFKKVN